MNPQDRGRKGRSTETASEGTLGKLLTSLGFWNSHVENVRGADGFPDRYLGRGFWIECKAFVFSRKRNVGHPKALHNMLRRSQKRTIPKLIAAGDTVVVCVFVHTEDEPTRFAIVDYDDFLQMSETEIDRRAVPWGLAKPEAKKEVLDALKRHNIPVSATDR